jgi:hypothetical protein
VAGTGSGAGGSPAVGTSDESTAGGVVTRYGQASSACATGVLTRAGAVSSANAATRENARVENIREVAIVTAD